jgi:hypothetical protein
VIVVACIILLRPPSSPVAATPPATPSEPTVVAPPSSSPPPEIVAAPTSIVRPTPPVQPAPTFRLGDFEDQTDVGPVGRRGYMEFDADKHKYTITGGGSDIYGKLDSFHFVWRKMSGNASIKAEIHVSASGKEKNRKACLMFRSSLEPDAAYADVAVHGDGTFALQWREKTGQLSNQTHPSTKDIAVYELERIGNVITLYVAKKGESLKPVGSTNVAFKDPVYVGLAVSPHDPAMLETSVFSEVKLKHLSDTLKPPMPVTASKPTASASSSAH